jgi:hypothetical protein
VTASQSYTEHNGAATESRRIEQDTFVKTNSQLFAVRFTEPWLNPATKNYETIAYLERKEAWNIFEPRLRQSSDTLRNIYSSAEKNPEPLKQFALYSAAQSLAAGELAQLLDFAQVLDADKAVQFNDVRPLLSSLPTKLDAAKSRISIYINSAAGADALVTDAIANAFSSHGFTVSRNRNTASYICDVTVNDNMQKLPAGTFYTPSVIATVSGKSGGSLFTYSANLDRVGAQNPDVARTRANTNVAGEIKKSFYTEFSKEISGVK